MLNLSKTLGWIGKIIYYFSNAFKGRNGIIWTFLCNEKRFCLSQNIFTLKNCAELNAGILERRLMQRRLMINAYFKS